MAIDVWEIPKRLTRTSASALSSQHIEEVRARLSRRPADALFNAVEAAIYLGRSVRTLKRAIDAGLGPTRQKNPDVSGKGAVNRHTHYRKSDLDQWAATLYGFGSVFSGRFPDFDALTHDQPWVVGEGRMFCHLLDAGDVDQVMELLQEGMVEFLRLEEALLEPWAMVELRRIYQEQFTAVLERSLDSVLSAEEKDVLLRETIRIQQNNKDEA